MRKSSAAILLLLLLAVSASAFPKRIISTMPSITETLFALGLGGSVVGVTQNDDYPPEAKKIEKIGRETVNLEKVIYLMPDLVIMLEDAQRRDVENLKKHNLPVITINPHNIKETLDSIMEIGRVCGATAEATKLTGDMEKRMSTMEADIFFKNKQSVLVVVGYKPLMAAGNNSFTKYWKFDITNMGASNKVDNLQFYKSAGAYVLFYWRYCA